MRAQGQREGNSNGFQIRTLRYSLRRVSPLGSVNCGTHNPTITGVFYRTLGGHLESLKLLRRQLNVALAGLESAIQLSDLKLIIPNNLWHRENRA